MRQRIGWSLTIACLALAMPAVVSAAVLLTIDDRFTDNGSNIVITLSGLNNVSAQVGPEQYDLHGEYLALLNLANGQTLTVNFNFTEPAFENPQNAGLLSDTLNIVFTGHTPTAQDPNTISVDLHFRSDGDPTTLPTLASPITLQETINLQDLTSLIAQATGVTDFQVVVGSDVVPEPSTVGLCLLGVGATLLAARRRAKQ
jgi:PEP-CTERM motif